MLSSGNAARATSVPAMPGECLSIYISRGIVRIVALSDGSCGQGMCMKVSVS